MNILRSIVRAAFEATHDQNVACFVKQLGARAASSVIDTGERRLNDATGSMQAKIAWTSLGLVDKKGGDPAEWADDLRVPETAEARARREAFFSSGGPLAPPGGKAAAVARRRAALEARGR